MMAAGAGREKRVLWCRVFARSLLLFATLTPRERHPLHPPLSDRRHRTCLAEAEAAREKARETARDPDQPSFRRIAAALFPPHNRNDSSSRRGITPTAAANGNVPVRHRRRPAPIPHLVKAAACWFVIGSPLCCFRLGRYVLCSLCSVFNFPPETRTWALR